MDPIILVAAIDGGITLVTKLLTAYNSMPNGDAELKVKFDELKTRLDATLAEVLAYKPKDV